MSKEVEEMSDSTSCKRMSRLVLLVALGASVLGAPTGALAATPKCNGQVATIVSSARVIVGTSGVDVIVVQGSGNHVVNAGAGNDVICGSLGNDRVNAGTGNDFISTGAGIDTVTGGSGNDKISGGAGNDTITGGIGSDILQGVGGVDELSGGPGSDLISGGAGNDTLSGGAGRDNLNGGSGTNYCTTDASDVVANSCTPENLIPVAPVANVPSDVTAGTDNAGSPSGGNATPDGTSNGASQAGTGSDTLTASPVIRHCALDLVDLLAPCTIDISDPGARNVDAVSIVSAGSELTFMWSFNDREVIDASWVKIAGPSGWVTTWCGFPIAGTQSSITSQGTFFTATCQVPQDAVNAEYTAYFDAVNALGQNPQSTRVAFRVTGGSNDSSAPVVSQISLSTPTLTYGQTMDITFSADDETGTKGIVAWVAFNGYGFANNQGRSFIDYQEFFTLTSGDEKSGTYRQKIGLNSYAPSGEYTVWISSLDNLGNKVFYQTDVKFNVS